MKHILLIFVGSMLFCATISAQYTVTKRTAILCDLPECQEEFETSKDTTILGFAADRSIGQNREKGISESSGNAQNIFFIESLNSILFIPQSFIPGLSSFYISGATENIIKIQIFNIKKELIFQTSVIDNTWNGKWKNQPQYGIFNYKITVKVNDNTSEVIEGLVVTKKPI
jgi:hypothetical protein